MTSRPSFAFLDTSCRWLVVAAAITALFVGRPAAAQSASDLYAQGVEFRRMGQKDRALEAFRRALELEPSARIFSQLGATEYELQRWVDAETHLTEALRDPTSPWLQKNRQFVERYLKDARLHIGELMVRGTPGASITVNDRPRGTLPLTSPIRLDEGDATVRISGTGYKPQVESTTIHAGSLVVLNALLDPVQGAAPIIDMDGRTKRPAAPPSTPWGAGRITGAVLVALGSAAAAGGVLVLRNRWDECAHLPTQMCREGRQSSTPGWALIGAGVGAAALGGVLLFMNRDVQVAALPSPHAFTLSVKGTL
jgi:hypothetical protein